MSNIHSCIALAVGAFVSTCALAQSSSVTITGLLDVNTGRFQRSTPTDASAITKVQPNGLGTSFLAFKGTEDLGGGLKAMFYLETLMFLDTGATAPGLGGAFWGRNEFLALQSDSLGMLKVGAMDSLLWIGTLAYNPFKASTVFSPSAMAFQQPKKDWINAVTYTTPNFNGITADLQASFKEGTNYGNNYALDVKYNQGPLSLAAIFDDTKQAAVLDGAPVFQQQAATTGYHSDKRVMLAGSYDFQVVKLFAQLERGKLTGHATAADKKLTFGQLGVSVPAGSGFVLAAVGQEKREQEGLADVKQTIYSIAYDYPLSKRTDVYAGFNHEKITDWSNGQTLAAGIRHTF